MDAVVKTSGVERALADQFATVLPRLPGGKAVAASRTRALDAFARDGLPHRRIEDWKYTDLRALMREVLPPAAAPDKAAHRPRQEGAEGAWGDGTRRLVLVDGVFVPALSDLSALEGGLNIRSLATRAGRRQQRARPAGRATMPARGRCSR